MKLDSESTYHHTYPNEHTPKVIVCNDNHFILPKDNHFMVDMLEINETLKEGKYGVKSPNEYDSCKVILPPKPHGIQNMEHSMSRNNSEYNIMKSPYSGSNPEFGLVVKEDFYCNEAVAKVESSETLVCISDGSGHRVENISITEGLHSFQNSFAEKQEVSQEVSFSSKKSSNNDNCDVEKEMNDSVSSLDLKYEVVDRDPITIARYLADAAFIVKNSAESSSCVSTIEGGDKLDTAEWVECNVSEGGDKLDTNDLLESSILDEVTETQLPPSEGLDRDSLQGDSSSLDCSNDQKHSIDILDEISEKQLSPSEELARDSLASSILDVTETQLPPSEGLDRDSLQGHSSSLDCSNDQKLSIDILDEISEKQLSPSEELARDSLQVDLSSLGFSDDLKRSVYRPQNDQALMEKDKSTTTNVSSAAKDSDLSDGSKEIISTCTVPSEVITSTLNSQETSISGKEENRENKGTQQSKQDHIGPRTEAATSDGATTSAQMSFRSLIHEDTNFNGSGFLSGPIANSGHIPYSGSISLRSDSSTTSTRSFAFPVMQSEWNSSPVKMAKANRRRGWRRGLLCCRF